MNANLKKWLQRSVIVIVVLVVLIQFIPVPRTNPPVRREVQWDSAQTRNLAQRACFDCHSNETKWPWYSYVAPVSWLVSHDTTEGRETLNFSEWDRPNEDLDEITEAIKEGDMPMPIYIPLHPEADLTTADKQALMEGLQRTLTDDPPLRRQR